MDALEDLPTSKRRCIGCSNIFDVSMRPEYVQFEIPNAKNYCVDCFRQQFNIERKLWEEEQRREIGPEWEGVPILKKQAFKKPIVLASSSTSSNAAGGGGPCAVGHIDMAPRNNV